MDAKYLQDDSEISFDSTKIRERFDEIFKLERFCRLWNKNNNGVPPKLAYTPPIFQHVFVPNSCDNDDDDDDDDDDGDDDDINGFVMMMMMMMMMMNMLMR